MNLVAKGFCQFSGVRVQGCAGLWAQGCRGVGI
jgi:hypothetical protein